MKEIWKKIEYDFKYEVSNKGRVRSLWINNRQALKKRKTPLILKSSLNRGYPRLVLTSDNIEKCFFVHRLVAEAFLKRKKNKNQVNHKDGIKTNNTLENLEWATASENVLHSFSHLNRIPLRGHENGMAILNEKIINKIFKLRKKGLKHREIAAKFSISRSHVGSILSFKKWGHVTLEKEEG